MTTSTYGHEKNQTQSQYAMFNDTDVLVRYNKIFESVKLQTAYSSHSVYVFYFWVKHCNCSWCRLRDESIIYQTIVIDLLNNMLYKYHIIVVKLKPIQLILCFIG